MDPWTVELIVTGNGAIDASEHRAASRDVERGRKHRVRHGVLVDRAEWDSATGFEGQRARHIVELRALALVSARPPVFSHRSAAVLHGLPLVGQPLAAAHVTVSDPSRRGVSGVTGHVFPLTRVEVVRIGPLLATNMSRTVIDITGSRPFDGGVVAADAALYRGLPRERLEEALDLAGPRKAVRRIIDVVRFAHPGAESAAESENRCTQFRLGIAPQQLQYEIWADGRLIAVVDSFDEARRIVCEIDGEIKFLDPTMAPEGAGRAVIKEKKREDQLRARVSAVARYGYAEACSPTRLRPILHLAGLHPEPNRPTLSDYSAVAREARPRHRAVVPM